MFRLRDLNCWRGTEPKHALQPYMPAAQTCQYQPIPPIYQFQESANDAKFLETILHSDSSYMYCRRCNGCSSAEMSREIANRMNRGQREKESSYLFCRL